MGSGSSTFHKESLPHALPVSKRVSLEICEVEGVPYEEVDLHPAEQDLVTSFVMDIYPTFTSYSPSSFGLGELSQLQLLRSKLNSVPNFLEFDHIFFPALSKHCPNMHFNQIPFSFKKKFTVDLIDVITIDKDTFNEDVVSFVEEHRRDCNINDYGSIGEILVKSMYSLHGSAVVKYLWSKAYSRFLRAVLAHSNELVLEMSEITGDSSISGYY